MEEALHHDRAVHSSGGARNVATLCFGFKGTEGFISAPPFVVRRVRIRNPSPASGEIVVPSP